MSWLDKLLGRGKKKPGETGGEGSMQGEGMRQEPETTGSERAEQMGQEEPPTERPDSP